MGILDLFKRARGREPGRSVEELAHRLGVSSDELIGAQPEYREFTIPKRSGGKRFISAPSPELKTLQRRILRRLLNRLEPHPCAIAFQPGYSIVSNAFPHAGRAVVVRMDLDSFFPSIPPSRVRRYFVAIGWSGTASDLLVKLCTHQKGLPQGAPTSPRLANLVNRRLDARLAGLAQKFGATYTRYADDLTFSFDEDAPDRVHCLIRTVKGIVADEGYRLHTKKKLHIRRRHQRQIVTGLVVNAGVALPRRTRRWLRAVEHHAATGRALSITPEQLQGWRALRSMVVDQFEQATRSE